MKIFSWIFSLIFCITLIACSSDNNSNNSDNESSSYTENNESNENNNDEPETLADAMKQAEDQMKKLQKTDPVNFRKLQELLPERLAGYDRKSKEGQTTGAMGFKVSTAEAVYKSGDAEVEVGIIDMGGISTAALGMAQWTTLEIDKEDENGFERTSNVNGNKVYEKHNNNTGRSEVNMFVASRFAINTSCYNCSVKDLHKVIKAINTGKLKRMK